MNGSPEVMMGFYTSESPFQVNHVKFQFLKFVVDLNFSMILGIVFYPTKFEDVSPT